MRIMLGLTSNDDGFEISFEDHLFFKHTRQESMISLGVGSGKFKEKYGNWKIDDDLNKRVDLTDFKIVDKKETQIKINLTTSDSNNLLVFTIRVVEGRLECTFEYDSARWNRFWCSVCASESESIYGCGEQFSELNLRGKKVPLWVTEQGCGRDDGLLARLLNLVALAGGHWWTTYIPLPTFVSSRNFFVHAESSVYAEFDFRGADKFVLHFWGNPQKIIVSKHTSAVETIGSLSKLLGRQTELPEWVFDGVWLGMQGGREVVDRKLQKALDNDVAVSVLWCQDWQGRRDDSRALMWNWEYDDELYPDLPDYIKELNEKGIRYMGYNNSFLAEHGSLYKEAEEKGYLVKDHDGKIYSRHNPQFTMGLIDLTNEDCFEWMKEVIKKNMIGIGLSGWMADYGESMPVDADLWGGQDGTKYHNAYPTDWARLNYEAIKESGKLGEIVFFTRAGYTNISKYTTCVWAGDQNTDWKKGDGLPSVIPAGLSLGISGVAFYNSDVGGFTNFPTKRRGKELFMRWAEHSCFTPIMRTHDTNLWWKNWQWYSDEETIAHWARLSRIYRMLKPYNLAIMHEYLNEGLPMMRHPYIHYEDDPVVHGLKYQYLYGRDLMVAPVIEKKTRKWDLYLPDDEWIHLWSGDRHSEGYTAVDAPLGKPPVFYRGASKFKELFTKIGRL